MAMKKDSTVKVVNQPITAETLTDNQSNMPATTPPTSGNPKAGKKKTVKKENGFVRFFKKIGRSFKEMWSEIKKVSWSPFNKALASTGIVLAVVLVFLLILTGMDFLFGLGFDGLIGLGGK